MKGKKPRDFTRLAQEGKAIRGGILNRNLIYIIVFLVKICVILWLVTPAATAQLADTPWPMFHQDLNHTGLSTNYGPDTSTLKWMFSTGDRIYGSAAIAEDGTIYIGTRKCASTWGSKLYAIYPNGTERWRRSAYHAVDFIDSTPAVASDGTVYVGCWDRRLYAFYPNGTLKWKFYVSGWNLGGFVLTSPAIALDGTIYIGNANKKLYAINPDGNLKWAYTTGGKIKSSPAIGADGTIYVGSNDRKLYAIYPNKTLKWTYTTGGRIKSSPAIGADGTVYVGSNDNNLYAINPDGTPKWSYSTGGNIISSPAIGADGIIYVGSNDGKLYAIYLDNGIKKWSYLTGGSVKSSPAIDADGTVYVGSRDKHVYAINPDGTLLWKYYTGYRIYYSSPAIASDGTVYIGNIGNKGGNGALYAFGPGVSTCEPSIEVTKTVWDPVVGAWVEAISNATINQTYRFRCEVHNNGSCCDLTEIKVVDTLSGSMEYMNNATVDGGSQEPDWQTGNQFGWNFTGPLAPSQKIVIEFDANVTGCGNDSNVQNATAYCAEADEWVSDEDDVWINVPDGTVCGHGDWITDPANECKEKRVIYKCVGGVCTGSGEYEYQDKPNGTDCGSDYSDSFENYCNGDAVWKHQLFHDFYCEAGSCSDHTSWVNDTLVENCNLKDDWYDTGITQWIADPANECREKEQKEQEYRDYTCLDGACVFSVTSTQWVDTGAVQDKPNGTDCGADYSDPFENYCNGDAVWKHQLFHDFYCEAGSCSDHTSWVNDTLVENCNLKDDWYDTGITQWIADPANECREKEQKEQEYRDYTCLDGACVFSVTSTQWVDTGAVQDKPNGTDCGADYSDPFENYCNGDAVWKHQLFHDFYCEAGSCSDHTSWVNDTLVEDCNLKDDWYDTGITQWIADPANECKEREQKEQEYRDYTCLDGACVFSVTSTQWVDTGAVQDKPNGTDCGADYSDPFENYCNGDAVWKHQLFHDFYCEAGSCSDHTSWVNDTLVENCNLKDDWYDTGITQWIADPANECKEKEQKEQEYRDYTCLDGACVFSVTSTQWVDTGAVQDKPNGTDCGADYSDPFENYCNGDAVWKHQLFHDFYCEAGSCSDHTSWVNDTLVEDCNLKDDWYDTGITQWIADPANECKEREQKEQEYRDYTCLDGACVFSVTSTQWVDTGAVQDKPNGTDCGHGDWEDDPDNPNQERREIYKCNGGTCTLDGYEYRPKGISIAVEPELTNVQPQDQFDVNISVNPNGKPVYAVEYYLHYDTSVVRAETQNKGPFLGEYSETWAALNDINQVTGMIHYAETRKVSGGVTEPGTVATIHFTAIGERGASSNLNFSGVIIVNSTTNESYDQICVINGTVEITDNTPPVPIGTSKHRINNVAKKYPCNTTLCSCSYDPDYPGKGGNITYLRLAFGDGQYGTSEGLPVDNCTCKEHKYESWQWEPFGDSGGHYVAFTVYLTVSDDGCPEETNTTDFDVTVYIAGDANGDGKVNILDAVYVGKHWSEGCSTIDPSANCECYLWNEEQQDKADLNNDCDINILDAVIIGANWGHVAW